MAGVDERAPRKPFKLSELLAEEETLLQDAKYKSYMSSIDKALKCFETTAEWHDLISSLQRLNKTLQQYQRYPVIPKRIIIGKRLAQCMHPKLPHGVHMKALDTYDTIFQTIGKDRLAHDLFIYSAGIFPSLANSTSSVRDALLKLYEKHFIPLGEQLRPGLNGFLVGVFPGIEEGSESHQRVGDLILNVAKAVGKQYFFGCLWKCVLCTPAIREPAISFVVSKFDKGLPISEQMEFLGTDRDCMVEAVCSSLQDTLILVQRNTLEFILCAFRLDECVLDQKDRIRLCTSSLVVLLRRDMGLNRRLYQWIFGSEATTTRTNLSETQTPSMEYFRQHSAPIVLEALRNLFSYSPAASNLGFPTSFSVLSPYRVLTALMDRNEISVYILDDILIDVFRSLYLECHTAKRLSQYDGKTARRAVKYTAEQEIVKAANLFFCNLEQKYLWGYLAKEFKMSCDQCQLPEPKSPVATVGSGRPLFLEVCTLLEFLLEVATLDSYKEAPCEYLPTLLFEISQSLVASCDKLSMQQLSASLKLCSKILNKVQPPAFDAEEIGSESASQAPTPTPPNPTSSGYKPSHSRNASNCSVDTVKSAKSLSLEEIEKSTTLPSMIGNCIETFQQLFLKFVELKVLDNAQEVANLFHGALCQRQPDSRDREMDLSRLLEKCLLQDEQSFQISMSVASSDQECPRIRLQLKPSWDEGTFNTLCSLIIELSSFPVSLSSNSKQVLDGKGPICDGFPKWLSHMLMMSCFAENKDCLLHTLSMTVELIYLSRNTVISLLKDARGRGVQSMILMPMIHPLELTFIMEQTRFMQVATNCLWDMLKEEDAKFHSRVADLLQKLHNLAPNDTLCENVLCRSLSSDVTEIQLGAQKRFANLWHLLRDIRQKPQTNVRFFDRCLFQMLDCLTKDSGPHRALSQFWLEHSLSRGDLNRILEPILIVLLHPDTARVGIDAVSVRKQRITIDQRKSNDDVDRRINGISHSVAANFILHLNSDKKKSRELSSLTQLDTRSLSLKSVNKYVTGMSSMQDIESNSIFDHQEAPDLFGSMMGSKSSLANDFIEPDSLNSSVVASDLAARKPSYEDNLSIATASTVRMDDSMSDCSRLFETTSLPGNIGTTGTAEVVNAIVDDLLDEAVKGGDSVSLGCETPGIRRLFGDGNVSEVGTPSSERNLPFEAKQSPDSSIPALHHHMLLYSQVFDCEKALYALQSIKNIIDSSRREALWQMANTALYTGGSHKRDPSVDVLLARHRKTVDGGSFQDNLSPDQLSFFHTFKYLDVVVFLCLQYLRSYYPQVPQNSVKDVLGNCNVRLLTCDVLQGIFSSLEERINTRKEFPNIIVDLLSKCKVQKILLHSLAASVFGPSKIDKSSSDSFTFGIIDYNDRKTMEFQDTFQVHLLKLICSLIQLEARVMQPNASAESAANKSSSFGKISFGKILSPPKYVQNMPIPSQMMFSVITLDALRQNQKLHLQTHWMELIMISVPYSVRNASQNVSRFIVQVARVLCQNFEDIIQGVVTPKSENPPCPPDYLITAIGNLRTLLHYCLLDESAQGHLTKQSSVIANPTGAPFLSNLFHAFSPDTAAKDGPVKEAPNSFMIGIRKLILCDLQFYLSSLLTVWKAVTEAEEDEKPNHLLMVMGAPRLVKQQILQCLQPISENYGEEFLTATGLVWNQRTGGNRLNLVAGASPDQLLLVRLIYQLDPQESSQDRTHGFSLSRIVHFIKRIFKNPPTNNNNNTISDKKKLVNLEVYILQFLLSYLQYYPVADNLKDAIQSLMGLWKEGLQMTNIPPVQFHLLSILHEFVQRAALAKEDRKSQKDLQEIAQKLIESISTIASASLEQTTWLRRTWAVKSNVPQDVGEFEDADLPDATKQKQSQVDNTNLCAYSVQALINLAEYLAPVLDIVYVSEDKEKVVPLLTSIMVYVTPFLRNHSKHNVPSFRACSQLLASFSGYQYTRKAWRKEAFDLLCDPQFFQMDDFCLNHWRSIIDHLMTHDKTTYRDFMARMTSIPQAGTLNIFGSTEKEYEQRAQLLKRLSYVIYCSEPDQYQKYLPDISERLADSLKQSQVPIILSQVFLLFRVILIRFNPNHVYSMWPGVITELVHSCLMMEQELLDAEDQKTAKAVALSHLQIVDIGVNSQSCLSLYLSACKLLDMAIALPADSVPQFQVYRWSFIGDGAPAVDGGGDSDFVPHMQRVAALLNLKNPRRTKLPHQAGRPILTATSIKSLSDLQDFFNTLIESNKPKSVPGESHAPLVQQPSLSRRLSHVNPPRSFREGPESSFLTQKTALEYIEHIIECDFLELRTS